MTMPQLELSSSEDLDVRHFLYAMWGGGLDSSFSSSALERVLGDNEQFQRSVPELGSSPNWSTRLAFHDWPFLVTILLVKMVVWAVASPSRFPGRNLELSGKQKPGAGSHLSRWPLGWPSTEIHTVATTRALGRLPVYRSL